MSAAQYARISALSLVAGFVGAIVANLFSPTWRAFAQQIPPGHPKVVEAQEFRLVDEHGALRGRFFTNAGPSFTVQPPFFTPGEPGTEISALELYGEQGVTGAARLWVAGDRTGFSLQDQKGTAGLVALFETNS